MKNIFLITDCDDGNIYFAIHTRMGEAEVRKIIENTKEKYPGSWSVEDIMDSLPEECDVVDINTIGI